MAPRFLTSLSAFSQRLPSGTLIALFGLTLTAAAWLDVLHRQATDREAEIERINRVNAGLARALDEHVRRVLQTADNALLFLREEYETHGQVAEGMINFVNRVKGDPILNQLGLADSSGNLILSAVPHDKPIDISEHEHFRVHAASDAVGLYLGKPVTTASGEWSFFLSRRLSRPDGSFLGVVTAGLDPAYFSDYYNDPLLGQDRGVLLVGRDGIVRARRFQKQVEVGQDLRSSPMFVSIDSAPVGHYEVVGSIDSLRRFVSYRAMPDYPLIVAVSDLTSSALAPFRRHAAEYRLAATIFTIFVAVFCLVLIRAERRTHHQNATLTWELAERRKSDEALRESQDLFSAFLENIPAAVFVQDLQGRTRYANQAYRDLAGHEAIGRNARELLAPSHGEASVSPPTLRGRSVALDETIPDGNGRARIFDTRMFVVDRAGKEPLLGCISVDSTARHHAERERLVFERRMQQTQKLESLGVLAGGIAHDFNNLLMVILGNADLALAKSSSESPVRDFIRNIDMAAQRAADLANQMLAYSGKGHFVVERINLSRLVEEMGHLLGSVIPKHVTVHYRLAGDLPPVEADATQIRQVVMNLITNASDALGGREGVITVATGVSEIGPPGPAPGFSDPPLRQGTYAFVEVADTGSGMDAATQARIFDPFFTTKHTGRGLGLASVLGIVRGHNGEIRVSSTPGRGTTFTVLLPVAPAGQPLAASPGVRQAPGPAAVGSRRTILIVDDEEHVLQTTRAILEDCGYSVVTAADGAEAVEVFRDRVGQFSAVVLDMNMPHMDGAEAFRQMHRIAPGVPVILTSGLDEQETVSQFTGTGLAAFIQKPFRMKALIQKLETAIAAGAAPPT